jgi:hypothetical protein
MNTKSVCRKTPSRMQQAIENAEVVHDGLWISEVGGVANTMDHIAIPRAVAYLIRAEHLTPSEEEHLVKCDECRHLMMQAAMLDPEIPSPCDEKPNS